MKSNPNLERDYRRETTEKMVQDLGVRLHLKGGKSLPNEVENIVETQLIVEKLEKLKDSGMSKENYEDYLNIINNHRNPSITDVYLKFGDEVENVKSLKGGGVIALQQTPSSFLYVAIQKWKRNAQVQHSGT